MLHDLPPGLSILIEHSDSPATRGQYTLFASVASVVSDSLVMFRARTCTRPDLKDGL